MLYQLIDTRCYFQLLRHNITLEWRSRQWANVDTVKQSVQTL
jgi:hypothetical protein